MRLQGRNNVQYVIDEKRVIAELSDGTVYQVSNKSDMKAKLLMSALCTTAKEEELNSTVRGEISAVGETPVDLLYRRGSFVGYVFRESQKSDLNISESFHGTSEDIESYGNKEESMWTQKNDNQILKFGISIGSCILFSILNYLVLFGAYCNFVTGNFADIAQNCIYFNFSGIPSILSGCILVAAVDFGLGKKLDGVAYYVLQPILYLAGMLAWYVLSTLIIFMIAFAVRIFIAIIPTVIVIAVIVVILKSIFKR